MRKGVMCVIFINVNIIIEFAIIVVFYYYYNKYFLIIM